MRFRAFVFPLILVCSASVCAQKYKCFPDGFSLLDKAVAPHSASVGKILRGIKARCSHGVLVDGKRKQIRLYRREGCWGNPPADYLEIMARQEKEILELRKRYTVIEVSCDPNQLIQ